MFKYNPSLCSFSLQSIFFSEKPIYGNYSTLDSHINTVISHMFAYSPRWRRRPWQKGLLFHEWALDMRWWVVNEAPSAELAIIMSYPTCASGIIVLLKTLSKSRWISRLYFVGTNPGNKQTWKKPEKARDFRFSHVRRLWKLSTRERTRWMKNQNIIYSDEHFFEKLIGTLGFYTAG